MGILYEFSFDFLANLRSLISDHETGIIFLRKLIISFLQKLYFRDENEQYLENKGQATKLNFRFRISDLKLVNDQLFWKSKKLKKIPYYSLAIFLEQNFFCLISRSEVSKRRYSTPANSSPPSVSPSWA